MPEDEKPTPDTEPTVPVDAVPGNAPEAAADTPGAPDAPAAAVTEAVAPEAPTEVAMPAPGAPAASAAAATEPSHSKTGPRWAVALVLVLLLGVGGGFLIGRATAPDDGPQSLADAVSQPAKGDLPVGQLDLQELLQSIGKQKGGALGQILGGGGSSGSDSVGGILGGLIDGLRNKVGGSSNGSSSGSDSSSGTAYLGVRAQAAPTGTTGVVVAEVAAGSPAADAGMQAGDVITKVGDTAVAQPSELAAAVQAHAPGDSVTITYTRNGTSATAKVRLGNASTATTPTTTPATTPATTQAPANA